MVKVKVGEELIQGELAVKIRLDFKGVNKPSRFLFGSKNTEKVAEEIREQRVAMLRNVPLQGITITDIDMSGDIYTVLDEKTGDEMAYAPVVLTVQADTIEDILKLTVKEEFRKIEILSPEQIVFSKLDLERILFKMNQQLTEYIANIERKYLQK